MLPQDRSNYYGWLRKRDLIGRVENLLRSSGYFIRSGDQKITAEFHVAWDYWWDHPVRHEEIDCHLWHHVMFDAMGRRFVPSKCQQCFKVVIRPQTLEQLFALLDIQRALGFPCKCGCEENRPYVHGLYGGYWYCRGLEQGLVRYGQVREAVAGSPLLSELLGTVDRNGVPKLLILKRGCTEFEQALGRSDKWQITQEQLEDEALAEASFVRDYSKTMEQLELVQAHIHRRWIEYAWEHGDPTAVLFNNGQPLHDPPMTYHYLACGVEPRREEEVAK